MIFNSLSFALFFIIVYILYLLLNHKWQNRMLLVASYVFYAFWDWRFLSLIMASTLFNYYLGLKIDEAPTPKKSKKFLYQSVCLNLIILGFFKYFNFFAGNLQELFALFGWRFDKITLNIVLPLGISFYTFQAMSYPIDIHRKIIKPTRHFFDFALFIAFFPQLVAGPIERARNLIPQISNERRITKDQFFHGCWLVFWGLYKKIFIADNLAKIANAAFGKSVTFLGGEILISTYAFALQVYADFSGYSDMARGFAKLMGFNLILNFKVPFFSSNLYDFWQRWHISLTTWVKEYIFYPLALARFYGKQLKAPLVILITWAIMGFWHGAAWKFVLWGLYHGLILVIFNKIRPYLKAIQPKNILVSNSLVTIQILVVFNLFCIGILFFAVDSVSDVLRAFNSIIFGIGTLRLIDFSAIAPMLILLVGPLLIIEFFQYKTDDETIVLKWPIIVKGIVYYVLLYSIIMYGDFSAQRYYYFQF